MKPVKARLIKRQTADGVMEIEDHIPLGKVYTVDLDSRQMQDVFNVPRQKTFRIEMIRVIEQDRGPDDPLEWFPTELLEIDVSGRRTVPYQDAIPLRLPVHTVRIWLVILPTGQQLLEAFEASMTVEEVHRRVKDRYPKFVLKALDVGSFVLAPAGSTWYSTDGRGIDQDWWVTL